MQINEDVMPSDTASRTLRHYGEFQMIIDVVVPARTPQMDYLHHPECDASKVASMIRAGKSAAEIARALWGIALQSRQSDQVSGHGSESASTGLPQPSTVPCREGDATEKRRTYL